MDQVLAKKKIQLLKNLPTLPGMIDKISKAVESKRFSAADVGKLISRDQVLTAKVLKLANSAFFGFSRKVGSLTQALVLLGFDVIKGLILTSSVFDLMKSRDMSLWQHSMGVATCASIIAEECQLPEAEEVSLAGLLHDLGKVVIRAHMSQDSYEIAELVEKEEISIRDAEETVLGFSHEKVGLWLAESWKLPENLTESIHYHHRPHLARQAPQLTAVVHLADVLVRGYGWGNGGDYFVPPLEVGALKVLEIDSAKLEAIIDQMCQLMVPDAPPAQDDDEE